jgi:uncharacterized protein YndB with AHSA1/START domain
VIEIEVTQKIPAPPAEVWAVYTDHAAFWSFMGRAEIERVGEDDPNGSGCIRVLGPGRFAAREEILDFDPPKRLTYAVLPGGPPLKNHLGEVLFEEEAGGTRIVWRARFESRIPGLGFILRIVVQRVFARALTHLESLFEASPESKRA